MNNILDNSSAIREILDFKDPGDFYVIHVLVRAKDIKNFEGYHDGSKESQRLIKTFYIDSLDYFDRKLDQIKEMAIANHARAYFLPQVRNRLSVNRVLAKKVIEDIDNVQVKYDRLIRSAVCGCHISRARRWVIDIDWENEISDKSDQITIQKKMAIMSRYTYEVTKLLSEVNDGYDPSDVYQLESPHGYHIVTPPFNIKKFSKPDIVKKDAMTNLFCMLEN